MYVPSWLVGLTKIAFYFIIIFVITFITVLFGLRDIIIENWDTYRCNPAVIPFAGLFGYDATTTFTECLAIDSKKSSTKVVKPYGDLFSVLKSSAGNMTESLGSMKQMMTSFTDSMMESVNSMFTKFGNIGATAQFLGMKVQGIFSKILALYVTLLYFAWSMLKGLEAIIRDPYIKKTSNALEKASSILSKPPKLPKIPGLGKVGKFAKKAVKETAKAAGQAAKATGEAAGDAAAATGKAAGAAAAATGKATGAAAKATGAAAGSVAKTTGASSAAKAAGGAAGGAAKSAGGAAGGAAKSAGGAAKKATSGASKKASKAFCFYENTKIVLNDYKWKYISNIEIGDVLFGGSIVEGVMQFSCKNPILANNSGILTTQYHHTLYNNKFIRASDVPNCDLQKITTNRLYDLDTSNHRIVCLNMKNELVVYTDFSEIDDDNDILEKYELNVLNNRIPEVNI